MLHRLQFIAALAGMVAIPVLAAELSIEVRGVRSADGRVYVAVHGPESKDTFPSGDDVVSGLREPARIGTLRFVVSVGTNRQRSASRSRFARRPPPVAYIAANPAHRPAFGVAGFPRSFPARSGRRLPRWRRALPGCWWAVPSLRSTRNATAHIFACPSQCLSVSAAEPSSCPACRQDLSLLQDGLHRGVLEVRRIAVLAENAFDEDPHSGSRWRPMLP